MDRRTSLALAAVLGILGFLLVTAVSSTSATRRAELPRKSRLIDQITNRTERVSVLDTTIRQLRSDLSTSQRTLAQRSRMDKAATDRLVALANAAGTTALRGAGTVVRMADSTRQPSTSAGAAAGAFRIHDADLQLVVNALFAAGAEAVAVNDSRLVATTPIRAAGDTIVVNFRPLIPPYRVEAIGARRDRFEASLIATRFRRWTRLFGLGFSVTTADVTVPAYTGRVSITQATPVLPAGAP